MLSVHAPSDFPRDIGESIVRDRLTQSQTRLARPFGGLAKMDPACFHATSMQRQFEPDLANRAGIRKPKRLRSMHMLLVIVGGFMLLGVLCLFGKLWGGDVDGVALAAKLFIPAWLAISLINMWVGVTSAGYTVAQELPILLVVFIVPAVAAAAIVIQFTKT